MRSSTVIALAFGSLAVASPLLKKKAYKWDYVTETVWVTVTEGELPATSAADSSIVTSTVVVSPTQEAPAYYVPVSSAAPVVISTTSTVAPVPTTSTEAPVETTSAAPVVVETPTTSAESSTSEVIKAVTTQATTSTTPVATEAASTTSAASASSATDFDSTCLYHHNVHRANHSAPDVTYDSGLAASAQVLSDRCSNAHDVTINGGGYGQNIASYGSTGDSSLAIDTLIASVITNMWYNGEAALYDSFYGQANPTDNFENWGHFSQVVWKSTTKIGCGATLCAPGTIFDGLSTWFAVCNYETAGNVAGEYATNVLPPTEGASSAITVTL